MSEILQLDIVTPKGSVFSGEVGDVMAPGALGDFDVLPGHASFVTTLRSGLLTCEAEGNTEHYFVSWGYAEVSSSKVVVLADSAEHIVDIDVARAIEARKRAEERMRQEETMDEARAVASLERAVARIHIVEHFGGRK